MRALAAAIALLGLPAAAQAQLSAERAQMRADIGRTFWIENPWGKGLELCPSTLRLILAADCPKVVANKLADLCGVIYPTGCRNSSPAASVGDRRARSRQFRLALLGDGTKEQTNGGRSQELPWPNVYDCWVLPGHRPGSVGFVP